MNIRTKDGKIDFKKLFIQSGLYLVLFLMLVLIIAKEPSFLSIRNFKNILTQSSVRAIIALGVAGLIVTQGTDLSVGRQVGFSAVISATLLQATTNVNKVFPNLGEFPVIGAIIIVMIVGMVIGSINGIIVAKLNVHPFIATLGMMTIVYGINSLYYDYVGASPISGFSKSYSSFAQGYIGTPSFNMSYLIIYAAVATAIMWILWNKTKFGKNVFAVGGNPEAAKVSGVNVAWTLVKIYALSGMYYAFGGLLEAGRIGSATNNLGNMYEMDAIAACVIGGVSFYGGVGKISGVITGVIILTVINYGLTYVGVSPYWQYIIKGMIIVAAVAFDAIKYSKKK
ncbi:MULTISPECIES: galactose/methyl galactoside ABC transporter permease MglC [Fusobacterium]|jgi:methyl-galactoside transport system permease protein|uniref:Galactose/methyl galactoside ABC transporter permease MglC n=3 Tax=Fusobacterium varium TaxID=856 RepID=A0ABN5JDQ3_FUSVA|nr:MULTISPECIES: galactose/methyl galactoside ABC transporter permease MglC [Fusobacterium]AVQ30179.1 galactose/methyl galactoside ABC transporter permease MglC [Fusobacterium varium ATCC 27725]EES64791.1 galactoside transport system permease protein MglC [Fusobacterium varium ATCC 27725]MCD7979382.1 galactose/methyl galactoside ABC transporter permease MglC [Fusobacterium sp.]MCF0170904.1 galactose/methyl galactoside ABC transporter permease MglC [Fusobacterium varium]MCF2671925.1 galactose/m